MSVYRNRQAQETHSQTWLHKHHKTIVPLAILAAGLLVAFFVYQLAVYPMTLQLSQTGTTGAGAEYPSDPIKNGQLLEQEISSYDAMDGIGPRLFLQSITDETVVLHGRLLDAQTGQELLTMEQTFPKAQDGMWLPLPLSSHLPAGDDPLLLQLWVDGVADDATLCLWLASDGPSLTVDGEEPGGSLMLGYYTTSGFLTTYYWWIAIPLVLLLAALWWLLFAVKAQLHHVFLLAAAVLGILFMFVFPPYSMYDEEGHIKNTLYYSAQLTGDQTPGAGGLVRRAEDEMTGFKHLAPTRDQYYHVWAHLFDRADASQTDVDPVFYIYGQPTQYIVPALGVTLGRVLGLGQVPTLYLGCLFQLALFVALVWLAVRMVPFKALFAMLGLFPFLLASGGSFLYDVPVNALSFLFIAWVLHLAFGRSRMRVFDIIALAVLALLLVPMKYAYLPLVLLPLIIPKARWPRPVVKRVFCILLIVGAVALLGLLVGQSVLSGLTSGARYSDGTEMYGFSGVFRHPREFARMFLASFVDQLGLPLRAAEFPLILGMPEWLHFVIAALLLLSVFPAQEESHLTVARWQKGWMAAIAVLCYLLVLLAALTWTPVGSYLIAGLQARYLIPVLPLLVLLAHGLLRKKRENDRLLLYSMGCVDVFSILYVFLQTIHNQVTV